MGILRQPESHGSMTLQGLLLEREGGSWYQSMKHKVYHAGEGISSIGQAAGWVED